MQLSGEDSRGNVAIPDGSGGRFHTYHKNGETFGGPRGRCHVLVSLMMEGCRVKGGKFQ